MQDNLPAWSIPLLVALGASIGAVARHAVVELLTRGRRWPNHVAVLVVNVTGCAAIAWGVRALPGPAQLVFVTGFCGAFTTFSAFSADNLILFYERNWRQLTFNVVGSLVLGFSTTFGCLWVMSS
jgi:CrcB protein